MNNTRKGSLEVYAIAKTPDRIQAASMFPTKVCISKIPICYWTVVQNLSLVSTDISMVRKVVVNTANCSTSITVHNLYNTLLHLFPDHAVILLKDLWLLA